MFQVMLRYCPIPILEAVTTRLYKIKISKKQRYMTLLGVAARAQSFEMLEMLLDKASEGKSNKEKEDYITTLFQTVSPEKQNLLHIAARAGSLEVVEYLLNKGISLTVRDGYGLTPATHAMIGGHQKVIRFLLDTKRISIKGLLCFAMRWQRVPMAMMLLKEYPNVSLIRENMQSLSLCFITPGALILNFLLFLLSEVPITIPFFVCLFSFFVLFVF